MNTYTQTHKRPLRTRARRVCNSLFHLCASHRMNSNTTELNEARICLVFYCIYFSLFLNVSFASLYRLPRIYIQQATRYSTAHSCANKTRISSLESLPSSRKFSERKKNENGVYVESIFDVRRTRYRSEKKAQKWKTLSFQRNDRTLMCFWELF